MVGYYPYTDRMPHSVVHQPQQVRPKQQHQPSGLAPPSLVAESSQHLLQRMLKQDGIS
jgi:hypothetical protein